MTTEIEASVKATEIIELLNSFGIDYCHYEFGLPTHDPSQMEQMVFLVSQIILQKVPAPATDF